MNKILILMKRLICIYIRGHDTEYDKNRDLYYCPFCNQTLYKRIATRGFCYMGIFKGRIRKEEE